MCELARLDRALRDLSWLQESFWLRYRMRRFGPEPYSSSGPLFCEVVIEWDEAGFDSPAEPVGC